MDKNIEKFLKSLEWRTGIGKHAQACLPVTPNVVVFLTLNTNSDSDTPARFIEKHAGITEFSKVVANATPKATRVVAAKKNRSARTEPVYEDVDDSDYQEYLEFKKFRANRK